MTRKLMHRNYWAGKIKIPSCYSDIGVAGMSVMTLPYISFHVFDVLLLKNAQSVQ